MIYFDDPDVRNEFYQSQIEAATEYHENLVSAYEKMPESTIDDVIDRKRMEYRIWHAFLDIQVVYIEQYIFDDIFRSVCREYLQSLSTRYELWKCKQLAEEFTGIVKQPVNFFAIHNFMRKNPIS